MLGTKKEMQAEHKLIILGKLIYGAAHYISQKINTNTNTYRITSRNTQRIKNRNTNTNTKANAGRAQTHYSWQADLSFSAS